MNTDGLTRRLRTDLDLVRLVAMKALRLILCLSVFVPAWTLLASSSPNPAAPYIGALFGVLCGCIFGGAIGPDSRIAEFLFGPKDPDTKGD